MNAQVKAVTVTEPKRSVVIDMSTRYGMEPNAFEETVRAICLPPDRDGREASRAEFAAFLLVAKEYDLNPVTKEIYGFRNKNGAIVPVVSVDGWSNIINSHPALDGIEFDDHLENGNLVAITARIWRKDRSKPTVVTEYMAECKRDPEKTPWGRWPRRMLRHKALIQCARYAFGFSGIFDPDEAERMAPDVSGMRDVTPRDAGPPMPPKPALQERADPVELVESGRDNGQQVVWTEDGEQPAETEDGEAAEAAQAVTAEPAKIKAALLGRIAKIDDNAGVFKLQCDDAVWASVENLPPADRGEISAAFMKKQRDLLQKPQDAETRNKS